MKTQNTEYTQRITILEDELKSAVWDFNYHTSKVEKAECLIELFSKKLMELKKDEEDVC